MFGIRVRPRAWIGLAAVLSGIISTATSFGGLKVAPSKAPFSRNIAEVPRPMAIPSSPAPVGLLPVPKGNISSPAAQAGPKNSVSVNFEDEVVEGLNQNPYDSLTQIGHRDPQDGRRLYRVRTHFNSEIKRLSEEMGYRQ